MKRFFALLFALACLPVPAGVPYVINFEPPAHVNVNLITNANFATPAGKVAITNFPNPFNSVAGTNGLSMVFRTGTNTAAILFGDDQGNAGQILNSTTHGGNPSLSSTYELQLVAPGKLAFVPTSNIQLGGADIGNVYVTHQVVATPANGGVGRSAIMAWSAPDQSNTVQHIRLPGIFGQGLNTNGSFELTVFTDAGTAWSGFVPNQTLSQINSTRIAAFYDGGPNRVRGVDLRGGLRQEKSYLTGLTNCPLDFASSYCVDITTGANALNFYTTNRSELSTNYEERVFVVRAGLFVPALTFPAGWTWLTNGTVTTPPTTIAAGTLLRLKLESIGAGTTNIIASAMFGTDTSFSLDADASAFFTRAGITNAIEKNAVNSLVVDLKANNLWNNFTNGFIYPFVGTGGTNINRNLVSSSYSITFHTPVGFTNGITFDGVAGYADTGFASASVPSLDKTNVFIYTYTATNNTPVSGSVVMGDNDLASFRIRYDVSAGLQQWSGPGLAAGGHGAIGILLNSTGTTAGAGPQAAYTRTNSTTEYIAGGGAFDTGAFAALALDDGNTFIGAVNNASGTGAAANFYAGTIKGAAFGKGLNSAQIATWLTIWETFESNLSRSGMTR